MLAAAAALAVVVIAVAAYFLLRPDSGGEAVVDPLSTTQTTAAATDTSDTGDTAGPTTEGTGYAGRLYCWDESVAEPGESCPPIAGLAALQWVFPTDADAADQPTCVPATSTRIPAAFRVDLLEYFSCTYPNLPNSTVYLGRWLDAEAARSAMDSIMSDAVKATPQPYDNNDPTESAGVDGTVWGGTDSTLDEQRFGFVYNAQPFTLELVIGDSAKSGQAELTKWNDMQQFRYADGVALGGSSKKP